MLVFEECRHDECTPQVRALVRAFKRSFEGQRLIKLIREKNVNGFLPKKVGAFMTAALRKGRKYTDAAGGKLPAVVTGTKRKHQTASSSNKQKCPGCGSFDHVYQDCVYRLNPYFNADPSIEFAQSSTGTRYYSKSGGQYIRERDLDPLMHKNDRGASMQRKRIPKEELSALPSKSLGRERSVSRSWDPSQNSRAWRFLCANRRNNRVHPGSPMRPPYW